MDGFNFYSSFGKPRPKPTTVGPKGFDFKVKDNYQFYLQIYISSHLIRMAQFLLL